MATARLPWQIKTLRVLDMVFEERIRQVAQYGHNEEVQGGNGPGSQWLAPFSDADAEAIQMAFRMDYETAERANGLPTWVQLIREEIAEAFEAGDDETLVRELAQVAALCVSWIEKRVPDRTSALR